jgi:hypothetical protein
MDFRHVLWVATLATTCGPLSLTAQSLTPTVNLDPSGNALLDLTVRGHPNGLGVVLFAPARVAPLPSPFGVFHVWPPTSLGVVPLSPQGIGRLQFVLTPAFRRFAAAFQALTADPALSSISTTSYALVGYEFTLIDRGHAVVGSYDSEKKQWIVVVGADPGTKVEVYLREKNAGHVTRLASETIGAGGRTLLGGHVPNGLTPDDQIEVWVNGVRSIVMR